jgi:hypothetical protein
MKFAEEYKIVPVANALDISAATADTDSINMSNYHRATFIFAIGSIATNDSAVTVHSGATNGGIDSTLYFDYALGGATKATANCDVLAATTNAATMTLTATTHAGYMLVIEVDASVMDIANGEKWLTVRFTDTGACTGLVSGFAILEPRYTQNRSATALA